MVNIKNITLLFLGILICFEIKIAIYDADPYKFSPSSTLMCMAISVLPLLMIASAAYKKSLIIPAWIVIVVGGFFQYVFHTPRYNSHDVMLMLVPWFVYWVVGAYSSAKKVPQSD